MSRLSPILAIRGGAGPGYLRFYPGHGSVAATFDAGTVTVAFNNRNGNFTVQLGALTGGPSTTLSGNTFSGGGPTTYVIGGNNASTMFEGVVQNGVARYLSSSPAPAR